MVKERDVLVIGAGPVGMTAALALRSKGLNATILEAEKEGRVRPGSRAIYIHKATLEFLEQISPGLGKKLADIGIVWQVKRTFYKGEEVYKRIYEPPKPNTLPAFTSLHQHEIEKAMYDACNKAGVEFVWEEKVTNVKTSEEGVTVETENGEWQTKYVIACDGARSVVRNSVGIKFQGPRKSDAFVVVDVAEDEENPLPIERVFHYQHPNVGGRNVLYVPFAGGWRIDLQLFEEDDRDYYGSEEGVREWLPKVMDPKYADRITWISTYTFYQVVAEKYTDDHHRVILAGEAAHLFAPFGARGLNSGVPDAIVAAEGIKKALEVEANEEERRKYIRQAAEERHKAGLWNRECSNRALEHIQGTNEEIKLRREIAAFLAPHIPSLGRWLDEGPFGPRTGHPELTTKY
ncbi:FAD-dependent monooxygenase [Ureibacillus sp. FSL K6-8385]|uniref:FAD-binding protein n=2 Tax=Caryophanaceae TaxID=186818 RepID=A0A540V1N1_9BACL|nr:FAD-dependent monooxygenase [Ureibacillus terrenus]MED3662029.1 FAD-dependent monooxygenase [Ureibacillus terrenus]MED3764692.1 FAD-dependent monooxygenase [Ureibacillus terrenus]TQE90655.1 FAD-binding protein [Ureibacillus terrenus]